MTYSVVIPAFNEALELPATLAALREAMRSVPAKGEIVVVDNNSTDATAAVARENAADKVVFEPHNQIARARNAGAEESTGHYLIFVDADTRIAGELLRETLDALEAGKTVGGGAVVHFEGRTTAVGRFGIRMWEQVSKLTQVAAGSYMFCRRDAFEAVGGFNEGVYASEEVWLSRALKRWGRERELGFKILRSAPAQTSARKMEWYSGPQVLGWVALMIFMPIAVRSRRFCGFWYKRPVA